MNARSEFASFRPSPNFYILNMMCPGARRFVRHFRKATRLSKQTPRKPQKQTMGLTPPKRVQNSLINSAIAISLDWCWAANKTSAEEVGSGRLGIRIPDLTAYKKVRQDNVASYI